VYEFLLKNGGEEPAGFAAQRGTGDAAAVISHAALSGTNRLAEDALDLWISVYGAEAGNLALKAMATGGVFLGGGISPKILPRLTGPTFMSAFLNKGRLRPLLEGIAVQVITNEGAGLLGAARCAAAKGSTVLAGAS
jgi:glucokinase